MVGSLEILQYTTVCSSIKKCILLLLNFGLYSTATYYFMSITINILVQNKKSVEVRVAQTWYCSRESKQSKWRTYCIDQNIRW
jgi:hypothetical protein